ncbi:hypothetical protein AWB76_06565 [Caballeronia temeraria]|uniref:Uncharacterized protein n=1 Tax=Caballeronia temeraria TaxID=1777137 RepID=A0A158D7I8_9BURK|nr:hypothetical protein AWB76_06565 [Caballeronia temeraria]
MPEKRGPRRDERRAQKMRNASLLHIGFDSGSREIERRRVVSRTGHAPAFVVITRCTLPSSIHMTLSAALNQRSS